MSDNVKVTTELRHDVQVRRLARALLLIARRQLAEEAAHGETTAPKVVKPTTGDAA
jgi:hypothetical protein